MPYRPEDLELDEGYWRALLEEVEKLPIPPTQSPSHQPTLQASAHSTPAEETPRPAGVASESTPAWAALQEAMAQSTLLSVEVIGYNRGGLIVHYQGMRGFVPCSHLKAISPDMDEPTRRAALADHIGRHLNVRVIELDPKLNRVVFSTRARPTDAESAPPEIPPLLRQIRPGETRRGVVTNLTHFGAFVDLGGYEGLVHVSELSWSRVNHPRDLLRIGQEVNVYVISVSPEEGRIALSLKRAQANPWETIEQRYHVGQIVHGTVTNVVTFGAFVKVENDLEGLVHISEMAEGNFMHPRNIVNEGDRVVARVIAVDSQHRRLALSMRGVFADRQAEGENGK
ncbi:MAG: S1 RNA-binding domain-containing protein [Chloroflexi bacterium]|jgi:small subunit ribosomal protein S1|uniref:30S ribosomal protein S1 n=1 Tax=Candidatus Roseilinea sp. NK_OTU-006 TaxID=2704250 RepID=UPI000F1D7682|nr:S1 RNA-binding domain-containing protein [Candidatus Roseilinea sp. NK_OTU-006]RMG65917.1 MAG: S1 RNA-binding domain-containing protein [Chloroflexota bacterium]